MRVIAGTLRGTKLQSPADMEIRPTTDRIKETLFNILAPDLRECNFLDLFSGTGAIGIEALSRGAKKCVFVDASPKSVKIIESNLMHTRMDNKSEIYTKTAVDAIIKLGEKGEKFDIIFMDPPYKKAFVEEALKAIKLSDILSADGYIVIEHETENDWNSIEGFKVTKEKVYRTTTMTFVEVI